MSYIKHKEINSKWYIYLVRSLRMPDNSTKKIMKLITNNEKKQGIEKLENKYKEYFIKKETELNTNYACRKFVQNIIFSPEEIAKLEGMKVRYKYLMRKLNKNQKKDIFDRFTANFTYNSNAIEGNSLTLKDVRIILFDNAVIKGKDLREIYETRNSRIVIDMILNKKFNVSDKDIIKIHKLLVKDIDIRSGYKKIPNVILSAGKEIYTTMPENVEGEMKNLIKWYSTNLGKMHPLELAAIFHGEFEKIHPFEDGNGRVGRFLINVILVKNNYPPVIIRKTMRETYIASLQAFDRGYTDRLKRLLIEKYKDTFQKFFEIYIKYV
ncbi:MAG: Fic family protein [Candidatus Aenigmarchaeota archaeon]|nr:Fic family protein [Candidatus Aenigmarchaeota archaeon]